MCGHWYMTGGTGWQLSALLRPRLVFMTSQTEISCFLSSDLCSVLQYRQCANLVIFFQFQVWNLEITSNLPVCTIRRFPPLFWHCREADYIFYRAKPQWKKLTWYRQVTSKYQIQWLMTTISWFESASHGTVQLLRHCTGFSLCVLRSKSGM